jgi:hypothetical protein
MTTITNTPDRYGHEQEVDRILKAAWGTAARRNPMALVKLDDANTALEHLRRMISDCLAKGLSATETCEHAVKELLDSAIRNTQPHDSCHGLVVEKEPAS